jgi:hypothetical protein
LEEVQKLKIDARLFIIGMLLVVSTMVAATQFALMDVEYEYQIINPEIPDYGVHYIGSDNSSDGVRVLRVDSANSERVLKIVLGNWSSNYQVAYSAAFGIVNEDNRSLKITYIEITSSNPSYLRIWLHGDRDAYASNGTDNSSILMNENGTVLTDENTIAWTLSEGDNNASTICSNITNPTLSNVTLLRDDVAGVRYTFTNQNAVSGFSDFVWVQVEMDVPSAPPQNEEFTGSIIIHYQS